MIRTKEELLDSIRARIGEDTSDAAIALVEDVTDTLTDMESRSSDDWKTRYEENDAAWRKKYRDRFFGNEHAEDMRDEEQEKETEVKEKTTFEELFS